MGVKSNPNSIRILIVDDDEDDVLLIRDAINDTADDRYVVSACHNPRDAIDLLLNDTADIVLCDYLMGASTGIDFITAVRAEGNEVPIILLTGMGDRTTDMAAMEAGASDFMSKDNITPEGIDRAIRYALASAERQSLLHTVLNNVDAAVVLIDRDDNACLWNPDFAELVERYAHCQGAAVALDQFVERMLEGGPTVTIGDRVLDRKVSHIPTNDSSVIILHDVTEHVTALREREAAEERAAHLAMNCSLTGLPNRNAFSERLDREIRNAQADGREFFLLNLDLDRFKAVNDIYGHATGDYVLKEIARRLSECCNDDEFIARLGGDEFMAIQPKHADDQLIPSLADRIGDALKLPISLDDLQIHFDVSIGAAIFPHHGENPEQLMSNSDIAMYRSKDDPLNRVFLFNETIDDQIREERQISQDLRSAIEEHGLDVHFQPQADMVKGEITGFEALVRWNHVQFGPVSPGTFIPIAEENGLITQLGELVLSKACESAAAWDTSAKVAVNISPVQILHVDLVSVVRDVLLRSGLPPSRLELEITESVLISDTNIALHTLRGLKNLGVSIALDDFGTGYSSLSTLISFPFDKVKIDRSFIADAADNYRAAVIVRTTINMAKQLGYRIIAEGVERQNQVDFLLQEGCHEMQGFLIGRPVPEHLLSFTIEDLLPEVGLSKTA